MDSNNPEEIDAYNFIYKMFGFKILVRQQWLESNTFLMDDRWDNYKYQWIILN